MKQEFFIEHKELISKQTWEEKINTIKQSITEDLKEHSQAKEELKKAVISAVESRMPNEPFGILFSGGIDSSLITLIAKQAKKEFICYTIGFQDNNTKEPEDLIEARKAAKKLGIKLKEKIFDLQSTEQLFKRTIKILGSKLNNVVNVVNVVNVGVGSVEQAGIELAKQDGMNILFTGLGSEEIFAGYERHKKSDNKQEECWRGLKMMYERDLLRDSTISTANKIIFSTPFLDQELIKTAMRIPDRYKINHEFTKIIIREVAEELGLLKEIAWRRKRAAQYGSRMNHALTKLTRKAGFEYKKDYLKSLE